MPNFDIAHIREQGVDIIIVPLDASFGHKTSPQQHDAIAELQSHADGAGLAGVVVPVWDSNGQMVFIAPQRWHPFFRSINLQYVAANINRNLYW